MQNLKSKGLLSLLLSVILVSSCLCNEDKIQVSFSALYRVSEIHLNGGAIEPVCQSNQALDTESRTFYQKLDTSLVFNVPRTLKMTKEELCAIDWRITQMDVTALSDYDEAHPAGASLNDILLLKYWYKGAAQSVKVADIKYGSLMLTDYNPYQEDNNFLYLTPIDDSKTLSSASIEVTIKDSFGNTLKVKTDSSQD